MEMNSRKEKKRDEIVDLCEPISGNDNSFIKIPLTKISHELRTPLTSIIGFAEMLLDDPAIKEKSQFEYLQIIRDEGRRLDKLIEALINSSTKYEDK